MTIPTVFAPIKSGDFNMTPITVHKTFIVSGSSFHSTASGYLKLEALYKKSPTPIGASQALNDPTNSIDGSYKHVIWKSIDHMYYRNAYDPYATFEHANRRYTYKCLNRTASVLSLPYMDFGESIKPGSFEWSSSGADNSIRWKDDGNGNIYDTLVSAFDSYNVPNYKLLAYWSFDSEFRKFENSIGNIDYGTIKYESRNFEPVEHSVAKNIYIKPQNYSSYYCGMGANFSGNSYIMTYDRPEFNPGKNEKFSISMHVKIPTSQSVNTTTYNTIISKRGTIRKNVYGFNNTYNVNGVLNNVQHISSSIEDKLTDAYPYDIEFINSTAGVSNAKKIRVRRSDGIKVVEVTSSAASWNVNDNNYIAVLFDTGSTTLYVNAASVTKLHSQLEDVNNGYNLMFGSVDRTGLQGLSGSIDEVRFYNDALTSTQVGQLKTTNNMSMFQHSVIGNIFYRQGIVVISPSHGVNSYYLSAASAIGDNWIIKYRGTHTIYQYETLCRVKKGSFNMTYNPTARQSFKSDMLINDMTGSVLMPYATTIGLYNDNGELLAVGKLGQAVQMRDDVDLNFLIRWDT